MKTSIANLIRLSIGRPVMGLAVFFLSLPAQAQQFVPQLLPQPATATTPLFLRRVMWWMLPKKA